jgi:hypothetical protein
MFTALNFYPKNIENIENIEVPMTVWISKNIHIPSNKIYPANKTIKDIYYLLTLEYDRTIELSLTSTDYVFDKNDHTLIKGHYYQDIIEKGFTIKFVD